ncbi:hypothetical protein [Streptomyces ipomoeae]|uniref:Uncharacterized protein n=1 Tax=Streptomyces ipomoeae 91-03 TaxID=698759 RepID=L1L0G8_9ACTN|nr:hypothetical protein [Streptomyces ipomoeae]EKX66377.1 hypothetical protein STRIP9103_09510 [Streptomyces ipomoeae 91-03]
MTDSDLSVLRERADKGDATAVDELVERATELGDLQELRRLADQGTATATAQLVELATEQGDIAELRRLSGNGNATTATATATDQLIELATAQGDFADCDGLPIRATPPLLSSSRSSPRSEGCRRSSAPYASPSTT